MVWLKIQEIFYSGSARRDKIILCNLLFSLAADMVLAAALIFNFWEFQEYIILRYNIYFGISALAPWYWILILPLAGLVIIILNFTLSCYFYFRQQILSYFFSFAASLANCLLLAAGIILIWLNS